LQLLRATSSMIVVLPVVCVGEAAFALGLCQPQVSICNRIFHMTRNRTHDKVI